MSPAACKVGEVGFTIEFGRPGVGVWFRDIQKACSALARGRRVSSRRRIRLRR